MSFAAAAIVCEAWMKEPWQEVNSLKQTKPQQRKTEGDREYNMFTIPLKSEKK